MCGRSESGWLCGRSEAGPGGGKGIACFTWKHFGVSSGQWPGAFRECDLAAARRRGRCRDRSETGRPGVGALPAPGRGPGARRGVPGVDRMDGTQAGPGGLGAQLAGWGGGARGGRDGRVGGADAGGGGQGTGARAGHPRGGTGAWSASAPVSFRGSVPLTVGWSLGGPHRERRGGPLARCDDEPNAALFRGAARPPWGRLRGSTGPRVATRDASVCLRAVSSFPS